MSALSTTSSPLQEQPAKRGAGQKSSRPKQQLDTRAARHNSSWSQYPPFLHKSSRPRERPVTTAASHNISQSQEQPVTRAARHKSSPSQEQPVTRTARHKSSLSYVCCHTQACDNTMVPQIHAAEMNEKIPLCERGNRPLVALVSEIHNCVLIDICINSIKYCLGKK